MDFFPTFRGDRVAAEEALERNLLTSEVISLFPIEALFPKIRTVKSNFKEPQF